MIIYVCKSSTEKHIAHRAQSWYECTWGEGRDCGAYQNEKTVGLQLCLELSSCGWSGHIVSRSSRHKGTWVFLCCPPFLLSVLELPESANSLQRSTWNLWPIYYYYYYSRLFCFVLFWTISLFLSLSSLFSATEEDDHWPPTLQLKLHYFQLVTALLPPFSERHLSY